MIVEKEKKILSGSSAGRGVLIGSLFEFEQTINQAAGLETSVDRTGEIQSEFLTDLLQRREIEDRLMKEKLNEATLLR